MRILEIVANEMIGFLGITSWIDIVSRPDYTSLLKYDGFTPASARVQHHALIEPVSMWDFSFSELRSSGQDVNNATGIGNEAGYVVRLPMWRHTGAHKTAMVVPQAHLAHAK